jgi:hypothetical protein
VAAHLALGFECLCMSLYSRRSYDQDCSEMGAFNYLCKYDAFDGTPSEAIYDSFFNTSHWLNCLVPGAQSLSSLEQVGLST